MLYDYRDSAINVARIVDATLYEIEGGKNVVKDGTHVQAGGWDPECGWNILWRGGGGYMWKLGLGGPQRGSTREGLGLWGGVVWRVKAQQALSAHSGLGLRTQDKGVNRKEANGRDKAALTTPPLSLSLSLSLCPFILFSLYLWIRMGS